MRSGRPRLWLLFATAALLTGCVVETPPSNGSATNGSAANAPAANSNVGEGDTRPMPRPSPDGSPTPGGSPDSANASGDGFVGKLGAYARAAAADLVPEQREALGRIPEEGRRLLALRGYLRAGGDAMSRWAWSRERIESYEKSPEYAAALAEVDKVRREFEAANPGYTLRVNTKVRSLDEQLSKWNETDSIQRAGEELLARSREEVAGASYSEDAKASDVRRFENFLRASSTRATPTLAVPGLSPHGQARAFDFQVMRGAQLVAGTSSSEESWDKAGWTLKLQEAVQRASAKFAGPLASPREPWHYDYRP